ncbi:hypothetical protein V6N13_035723 [Hibiscus sabdariffa]
METFVPISMLEEKVLFLTDDGTQIQATMFNEAARKFYEKFQLGKDEEMLVPHSDIVLRISKWRSLHQ